MRLGEKAFECLRMCGMEFGEDRVNRLATLSARYSEKAVYKKLEDLADKGYIEFGASVRGAWLTEKGKAALSEAFLERKLRQYKGQLKEANECLGAVREIAKSLEEIMGEIEISRASNGTYAYSVYAGDIITEAAYELVNLFKEVDV